RPLSLVRPRSRRRVVAIAIVLLLLLGAGGALWWWLAHGRRGLTDELKYLPNHTQFVASLDVKTLVASPAYKEWLRAWPLKQRQQMERHIEAHLGLTIDAISRVTLGGLLRWESIVLVVKTNEEVQAGHLRRTITDAAANSPVSFFTEHIRKHQLHVRR